MTQPEHQFRVVLRGYDPADVDRVVTELSSRTTAAGQAAQKLHERLQHAEAAADAASEATPAQPATFGHLGERVGQILELADQEATELRDTAYAEIESARKDAEQASIAV